MRITGGELRGHPLYYSRKLRLRPTQDKVRGAIFNVLGDEVIDRIVFDLFAGTGSFGLDALSRGAKEAFFIEISRAAVSILRRNIESLGYNRCAHIIREDASTFIKDLKERVDSDWRTAIVFIDPPYESSYLSELLPIVKDFLPYILIVEHSKREPWQLADRTLSFGDTRVSIYYREG